MDFSDTTNNDLLAKLFDLVREERELAVGLILCLVELNPNVAYAPMPSFRNP